MFLHLLTIEDERANAIENLVVFGLPVFVAHTAGVNNEVTATACAVVLE